MFMISNKNYFSLKKKLRVLVIAALVGGFAFNANAQEKKEWSLEDCINYSFNNNINILKSKLNAETNKADLLKSKLDLLPSLSASVDHTFSWGRALNPTTNEFNNTNTSSDQFNLRSQMTLFNGFAKMNTIKSNTYEFEASKLDTEEMKNTIALNITGAYLDVLFNQELVKVSEAQVEVSKEQVSRTEKLVEAGSKAKGDLLNVKSQLAAEQEKLVKYQNSLYIAKVNLQQYLDLPINPEFQVVNPEYNDNLTQAALSSADAIYQKAEGIMPEVQSAELRLRSADKNIQIAKGVLYPSLSMGGGYGTNYSNNYKMPGSNDIIPFHEQLENNASQYLAFSLSIPIFNNYMARTNLSKAKINRERMNYELEDTKLKLRKSIESAYTDALAAWRSYQSSMASVEFYKESFSYTEQKYEVGLVSSYDYNLSKSKLTEAESNLVQAKFTYLFKTKVLDFYLGNPLTL